LLVKKNKISKPFFLMEMEIAESLKNDTKEFRMRSVIALSVLTISGIVWLSSLITTNPNKSALNVSVSNETNTVPATKKNSTKVLEMKNSIGIELIKIPSGSFTMGSPTSEENRDNNEGPQRKITVNYEFYIGKYEITQEEYEKVMGNNPSHFRNCPLCPVEQVSWNNAKDFIQKLNSRNDNYVYRLPSEAEWEYAARAGTTTAFAFGNNLSSDLANFDGNYPHDKSEKGKYVGKPVKVGSYEPNAWGLHDMHGNVLEWCEDIYSTSYNFSALPTNGSPNLKVGNAELRVLRGGSWSSSRDKLRSASRAKNAPYSINYVTGFRVAARAK
jgi:formylglycine-generating enzyme required for sulfatase activity